MLTVNKEHYIVILNKFWRTLCACHGVHQEEQWFQQEGTTPHTANITMKWLDRPFASQLISRCHVPEWSPHLPDLNPPDFYLRGFLKDHVYQKNSQTIAELKVAITQQTHGITREECVGVIDNFARWLQVCHQRQGTHLEHDLARDTECNILSIVIMSTFRKSKVFFLVWFMNYKHVNGSSLFWNTL